MGVYASGNSYGIPEDLIYSFPVEIKVSLSNKLPVLGAGLFNKCELSHCKK